MLHHSHAPAGYQCPFCELLNDLPFSEGNLCAPTDMIYQTRHAAAIMACDRFGKYGGHVMIIPTAHLESLYDLDDEVGAAIMRETRRIALAMKLAWAPEEPAPGSTMSPLATSTCGTITSTSLPVIQMTCSIASCATGCRWRTGPKRPSSCVPRCSPSATPSP